MSSPLDPAAGSELAPTEVSVNALHPDEPETPEAPETPKSIATHEGSDSIGEMDVITIGEEVKDLNEIEATPSQTEEPGLASPIVLTPFEQPLEVAIDPRTLEPVEPVEPVEPEQVSNSPLGLDEVTATIRFTPNDWSFMATPSAVRQASVSHRQELDQDIEDGLVRPRGADISSLRAIRGIAPGRRGRVVALLLGCGILLYISVQIGFGSGPVAWSARANLVGTEQEVVKLPTLGLPLADATAEKLTTIHAARAKGRAKAHNSDGPKLVERLKYVGPHVESEGGSVSVFAGRSLWAAAAREPNGDCAMLIIALSGWSGMHGFRDQAKCTAADAVRHTPAIVEYERRYDATFDTKP